jgi:ElaB/YqjD/DUF883 family membrane-anchored ribosome-binding protein
MASELAPRIAAILGAVEREADRILDEVREQAEHEIEVARRQADGLVAERQRRISELSDALVERAEVILERVTEAEAIRASFERLVGALAQSADRLALDIEAARPGPSREVPRASPAVAAATRWGMAPGDDAELVQRARHAAIRMAAAGTTRGEVAIHLRDSLRLANPSSLLDEIFGPGTTDDARVPWAIGS